MADKLLLIPVMAAKMSNKKKANTSSIYCTYEHQPSTEEKKKPSFPLQKLYFKPVGFGKKKPPILEKSSTL